MIFQLKYEKFSSWVCDIISQGTKLNHIRYKVEFSVRFPILIRLGFDSSVSQSWNSFASRLNSSTRKWGFHCHSYRTLGDCTGSIGLVHQSVSAVLKNWPQCGFHSLKAVRNVVGSFWKSNPSWAVHALIWSFSQNIILIGQKKEVNENKSGLCGPEPYA